MLLVLSRTQMLARETSKPVRPSGKNSPSPMAKMVNTKHSVFREVLSFRDFQSSWGMGDTEAISQKVTGYNQVQCCSYNALFLSVILIMYYIHNKQAALGFIRQHGPNLCRRQRVQILILDAEPPQLHYAPFTFFLTALNE